MSNCCVNCINDPYLRSKILDNRLLGDCDYCGSHSQSVINVNQLTADFESFFCIYDVSQRGAHWELYIPDNAVAGEDFAEEIVFSDLKPLHEHIQNDWSIFSDLLSDDKRSLLLTNIISNSLDEYIKKYCSPETLYAHFFDNIISEGNTNLWNQFCKEIKTRNRYILRSTPIKEVVDLLKTKRTRLQKGQSFYRARLGYEIINKMPTSYPKEKMGMAPASIVSDGRANPRGISYLYVASDDDTAVAEVRPWKSAKVSVATLILKNDIEIADLTMSMIESPFHTTDLRRVVELQQLLEAISMEFSKPVSSNDSGIEYIPTQYIAELIKAEGYKGFKFKSSIAGGHNFVFFDTRYIEIMDTSLHEVTDIRISQSVCRNVGNV